MPELEDESRNRREITRRVLIRRAAGGAAAGVGAALLWKRPVLQTLQMKPVDFLASPITCHTCCECSDGTTSADTQISSSDCDAFCAAHGGANAFVTGDQA